MRFRRRRTRTRALFISTHDNRMSTGAAAFEEILEDQPDLDQEDIQQTIECVAWLTQEEVHTV
jgi:uncharacterized protein (DUF433 family)